MRLEVNRYKTHVDVAVGLARHCTLNKLQATAVLLPAASLDAHGTQLQEDDGRQHFQYVSGGRHGKMSRRYTPSRTCFGSKMTSTGCS